MSTKNNDWLYTISPKQKLIHLNFSEIWRYRDLLFLFVKRDVITQYKQTILGPLWYFIQPLFTGIIFTLIFNNLAAIPTGNGIPPFLFNLAGITSWNYFSTCLTGTSNTFTANQGIFGKVYFPRVITPLSVVFSNLLKFGIQLLVFVCFYLYFVFFTTKASNASPQFVIVFLPLLILFMGFFGLGIGMIISSMTTKYRDLTFLVGFGVQLLMYGSAVMYPLSYFKEKVPEYSWLVEYNPMTIIIELFRYMTLGIGDFSIFKILYVGIAIVLIFSLGLIIFNKTEKTFIDTV
ncbi:ABC transporter permease [Algibacter amylolyticus]|uniref:Transport permease protein n=1 Tax=Algibacter amylolyticus TaxID=1608400 RepID=A0A5M7AZ32_9FLAO|nr:ABC transporter permease [Algibacter amylolyticus]KAA5822452.1 ABC transporter permease [Algibacter amylolyticus]MBB5269175.1 lipopolysaccharide transport system permease protein [Algibacter amylolyticus]TSJ73602.1 ABC transporter permease [Algibacter amylolyticus]